MGHREGRSVTPGPEKSEARPLQCQCVTQNRWPHETPSEADQRADLADQVDTVRAGRNAAGTADFEAGYPITAIAKASRLTSARISMILGHLRGKAGRPAAGT